MASRDARDLLGEIDVVDLHVDSYIWHRLWRRSLTRAGRGGLLGHRYYGQVDVARAVGGGLTGAMWSVTTNPLRRPRRRPDALRSNLARLATELERGGARVVGTVAGYRRARAEGRHGAFLAVQGGNALDPGGRGDPVGILASVADRVCRVTLVHLTSNRFAPTSAPLGRRVGGGDRRLSVLGRRFVEGCNEHRVLVDLAHLDRSAFDDALAVHDRSVPPIVTHTGVAGVHPRWRNVDDDQLRSIAERGGTVGIMVHGPYLGERLGRGRAEAVALHAEHVTRVVGEEHVSFGSDWDGAIVPVDDLRSPEDLLRFVDLLLGRGWPPERIERFLGANALRVIEDVRG